MSASMRLLLALAACLAVTGCYGQVQRTLSIESEPPGALCWLNDAEVGRTPVTVLFTWYGTYGVRLEYPGYETLNTKAAVTPPEYEWIGLDLFFETLVPGIRYDTHDFKYALKKAEPVDPQALRQRAEGFRRDARMPAP
jgi:hypothetical protein